MSKPRYVKVWTNRNELNTIKIKEIVDDKIVCNSINYTFPLFINKELPDSYKLKYKKIFKDIVSNNDVYMYEMPNDFKYYELKKEFDSNPDIKIYFKGTKKEDLFLITNYFNETFSPNLKPLNILNIDIELKSDKDFFDEMAKDHFNYPITVIGVNNVNNGKTIVLGYKASDNKSYLKLEDERHLIETILLKLSKTDIVTGWNVSSFDLLYLLKRAETLNIKIPFEYRLWKNVKNNKYSVYINHLSILDYLSLYKKFAGKQLENYKLNTVCEHELKLSKLNHDEEDFTELYENNFEKLIDYNKRDVDLVYELDKKLKLIEFGISFSYMTKVNFERSMSTISPWENLIACEIFRKSYNSVDKKIIPYNENKSNKKEKFEGGWTYLKHRNLKAGISLIFDITSSYPNQIIAYNISKDVEIKFEDLPNDLKEVVAYYKTDLVQNNFNRIIDDDINNFEQNRKNMKMLEENLTPLLVKYNCTMTPTGLVFKKDKLGFIPEIIDNKLTERLSYKKDSKKFGNMLDLDKFNEELKSKHRDSNLFNNTLKTLLNGYYGANGNNYFQYYNLDYAKAIPKSGQLAIRGTASYLIGKGYNYYNTDTDSLFIDISDKIDYSKNLNEEIDRIKSNVFEEINFSLDEQSRIFNHTSRRIYMENEAVILKGTFVAKKSYAYQYLFKDGQANNSYKFTKNFSAGSRFLRSNFQRYLEIMFREDMTPKLWKEEERKIRAEFDSAEIEYLANDINLTDIGTLVELNDNILTRLKINQKIKPLVISGNNIFHKRASLIYNYIIDEKKLKYDKIRSGDKVKIWFVKTPNKYNTDVIATNLKKFPVEILNEFELDYDMQFNKVVYSVINRILFTLGITSDEIEDEENDITERTSSETSEA